MQNLDFSRYLQERAPASAEPQGEAPPAEGQKSITQRNRKIILALVLIMTAFAFGFMAGVSVGKIEQIESSIISRPDDERPEYSNRQGGGRQLAALPAGESKSDQQGAVAAAAREAKPLHSFVNRSRDARFLIKVGTFGGSEAGRLAGRLSQLSELRKRSPARCRNVVESAQNRGLVFRYAVENSSSRQQNVLVGCFDRLEAAEKVLKSIIASGIPGTISSQLYEIEE